jgi:hypothetical protein
VAFIVHDIVYGMAAGYHGSAFVQALLTKTVPSGIYTLLVGSLVFYFVVAPSRAEA